MWVFFTPNFGASHAVLAQSGRAVCGVLGRVCVLRVVGPPVPTQQRAVVDHEQPC